jgi:cellulose synthase/poly-beta-1,6-N-acetylglucosamine synthase-like glycosyltransferase
MAELLLRSLRSIRGHVPGPVKLSYVSDVMARTRRTRPFPVPDPTYQPMVSVHIPAYNEPPEILIATINAVEEMDYPNFEIVVLDNNTPDEAVWGPVAEYCNAALTSSSP